MLLRLNNTLFSSLFLDLFVKITLIKVSINTVILQYRYCIVYNIIMSKRYVVNVKLCVTL